MLFMEMIIMSSNMEPWYTCSAEWLAKTWCADCCPTQRVKLYDTVEEWWNEEGLDQWAEKLAKDVRDATD